MTVASGSSATSSSEIAVILGPTVKLVRIALFDERVLVRRLVVRAGLVRVMASGRRPPRASRRPRSRGRYHRSSAAGSAATAAARSAPARRAGSAAGCSAAGRPRSAGSSAARARARSPARSAGHGRVVDDHAGGLRAGAAGAGGDVVDPRRRPRAPSAATSSSSAARPALIEVFTLMEAGNVGDRRPRQWHGRRRRRRGSGQQAISAHGSHHRGDDRRPGQRLDERVLGRQASRPPAARGADGDARGLGRARREPGGEMPPEARLPTTATPSAPPSSRVVSLTAEPTLARAGGSAFHDRLRRRSTGEAHAGAHRHEHERQPAVAVPTSSVPAIARPAANGACGVGDTLGAEHGHEPCGDGGGHDHRARVGEEHTPASTGGARARTAGTGWPGTGTRRARRTAP